MNKMLTLAPFPIWIMLTLELRVIVWLAYPLYVLFWLLLFWLFVVLFGFSWWKFFCSIISGAHNGYLQLVRISPKGFSVLSSFGMDKTVLALCVKVLMTLYLTHYVVRAVPMQVLVCMGTFSVYACGYLEHLGQ